MPGLIAAALVALAGATGSHLAPSGLVYSSANARVIQRQPAAGSCKPLGSGLNERPDRRCTPGAVNPAVTQSTIDSTICRSGWTATVRNDARNLWPEPDYAKREGFYLNPKDRLETALKRMVCARRMTLAAAQHAIAADWVSAFARFG